MPPFNRKTLFRILLIAFLTLAIGVIVNKITDKLPDDINLISLCAIGGIAAILYVIFTTEEGKGFFYHSSEATDRPFTPTQHQREVAEQGRKWFIPIGVVGVMLFIFIMWKMAGSNVEKKPGISQNEPDTASTQTAQPNNIPDKEKYSPVYKSGFEMVMVKGGTFTMGSPGNEQGRGDDECEHSVTVGDFSIGKYEITQADWREVIGSDPPKMRFDGCNQCPVQTVSWDMVQQFIKNLNKQSGKHYRLPTEEEWEFAAQGGNLSRKYQYSGSNNLSAVGWFNENSNDKTHPVGNLKANELGIFDMSGNVTEWCADNFRASPNCKTNADSRCSDCRVWREGFL